MGSRCTAIQDIVDEGGFRQLGPNRCAELSRPTTIPDARASRPLCLGCHMAVHDSPQPIAWMVLGHDRCSQLRGLKSEHECAWTDVQLLHIKWHRPEALCEHRCRSKKGPRGCKGRSEGLGARDGGRDPTSLWATAGNPAIGSAEQVAEEGPVPHGSGAASGRLGPLGCAGSS